MVADFDPTRLETLLPALDPLRTLGQAGFRAPASEKLLRGLPPDLQALWRWRDGQDRERSMAETARGPQPVLFVQRFGITKRLRSQGRLLPVAEARELAVNGFIPVFEATILVDERPTYIGRCDDGVLRYSFGDHDRDVFAGDPPGPRSESGRGDLASWLASLEAARKAVYFEDLRPLERAQRWVMALPGLLGESWSAEWDAFGMRSGESHMRDAVFALHRDWGIDSAPGARERLAELLEPEQRPAWDLCRAVAVAGWSHRAGFLPLEEAWDFAVRAARKLQPLHGGWFSMAEAYLSGYDEHFGEDPDPIQRGARERLGGLHALPCSPWNLLPWRTPLPEVLPPPAEPVVPDVFVVGSSAELHEALFDAPRDSIIRLRAGRYRGCFQARETGLTIEAMDGAEVTLEPLDDQEGAPVLIAAEGALVLRGLRIVPSHIGLFQQTSYVRVEDCVFEGGDGDGISIMPAQVDGEAVHSDFVLQISRTRFSRMKAGALWASCGLILMEDVTVDLAYGSGLSVIEHAELRARATNIVNIGKSGIRAAKGGKVWLSGVTVCRVNQAGISLVGGDHELHQVEVSLARSGLAVDGGASVLVSGSRFRDCTAANVELVAVGSVRLVESALEGGEWAGLWCHPGHGALLVGGRIGGSRVANVFVDGGTGVSLHALELGPSREGSLVNVANGGELGLMQCHGKGSVAAALEVSGGTLRLLGVTLSELGGAGIVAHSGARIEASWVRLDKVGGDTAVWLAQGSIGRFETLEIDGVGSGRGPDRKGGRGLVVGEGSTALVRDLVVRDLGGRGPEVPDQERALAVLVGERSRCAISRALALGGEDDTIQVITGALFAARELSVLGQSGHGVLVSAAELRLEHSLLQGRDALSLKNGAVATLIATRFERGAVRVEAGSTLNRYTEWPEAGAGSTVTLDVDGRSAISSWGVTASLSMLARLVALVAHRRGFADVRFRPDARQPLTLVLEGSPEQVAALVSAVGLILETPGALGLALAEVVHEPEESDYDEDEEDEEDEEDDEDEEDEEDEDDEDDDD